MNLVHIKKNKCSSVYINELWYIEPSIPGERKAILFTFIFLTYTPTYIANHGFVMNYKLIELVKR